MKQNFLPDFPGVQMMLSAEACVIASADPLLTLSSAVLGGGFQRTRTIINRHVDKNYNHPDPANDLRLFAQVHGLVKPVVGLLTGVWMKQMQQVTLIRDGLIVWCILTAGVSNAVSAGCTLPVPFVPGTINAIFLLSAQLSEGAMVNAVMTATEAKALVLAEVGIRSSDGNVATGTSTDALVIACVRRGAVLPYAGPGTTVGYLVGASMRQALQQALQVCVRRCSRRCKCLGRVLWSSGEVLELCSEHQGGYIARQFKEGEFGFPAFYGSDIRQMKVVRFSIVL